jgi:hypothetical protein
VTSVLDPLSSPQDWDTVSIGGVPSPGICKLSGFKREFGWQQKRGKGARGSTVTLNEYPAAEGKITFQLWTSDHFQQWADFRALFKYDPIKKTVSAVDIYHPSLADIDVTSVVCKDIGAIEHQGEGLFTIEVNLIEYNPPPKASAVSTPDNSKAASPTAQPTGKTPPSTAEDVLHGLEQQRSEASQP